MKNNDEFISILIEECKKQDIDISPEKAEKLAVYKDLLLEWNEKINLTAITDEYEIIVKHFVDCLECTKALKEEREIVDIGTGAGFPGMVLAIYYPEKNFTLIDALNKRILFLDDIICKLQLNNVKLIHGRAEEVVRINNLYEAYDACVSRAVAQLPVLLEYTSPYIKVNGKCIIMKGDSIEDEIKLSQNALKVLNLKINKKYYYSYTINNEKYSRTILDVVKNNKTPSKYPRNYGKIKKAPL